MNDLMSGMMEKMKMAKMGDMESSEDPEVSVLEEILALVQEALGDKMKPRAVSMEVKAEPVVEEEKGELAEEPVAEIPSMEEEAPSDDDLSEEEKLVQMIRGKGKM